MYDRNDGKWYPKLSGDISDINNPPSWFNIDKLGNLEDSKTDWWYETHEKLIIGLFKFNQNTRVVQLYRGYYGNIIGIQDKRNGTANE